MNPAELIAYVRLGRDVSPSRLTAAIHSQPPAWAAVAVETLRGVPWVDLQATPASPDVLLHIGDQPAEGLCSGGRLATWSLLPRRAPFPHQMAAGQTVFDLELYAHDGRWDAGTPLRIIRPGIWSTIFAERAVGSVPPAAALLLLRALFDLASGKPPAASGPAVELPRIRTVPALDRLRIVLPRIGSVIAANTIRRGKRRQWFSAWRYRNPDGAGLLPDLLRPPFQVIDGRPGMGYADPFPVSFQGREYLLIEEILPDERGRLVAAEAVDGRLTPDPPAVILEHPYHLSYPCVFEHGGEFWMIPESADACTVDLYRAVEFPWRWGPARTLARGVRLVDTTPFFHDGLWYFFTSAQTTADGRLFTAPALDGQWTEHPMSPISTDARRARSAGHLFRIRGQLYRPVQDCSTSYGMAVRIMQVLELSPARFAEREAGVITPVWHREAVRTHTWNAGRMLECIDGGRWR